MTDEISLIMLLAAVALYPLLYGLISSRHFQPRNHQPKRPKI